MHLIDLWNVIESFRDTNLSAMDLYAELDAQHVEIFIRNMYVELNKRLSYEQHVNVELQKSLLLAWLLNLYDRQRLTHIKVISLKVALTTMCSGKLVDKIKCKRDTTTQQQQ